MFRTAPDAPTLGAMTVPQEVWRGCRAIVTGASSGIGAAIAERLVAAGARVVMTGRDLRALDRVATACLDLPGEVETVAGDLTSEEVQQEVVAACRERFGGVDLLVNNAGISMNARFADLDEEVLRQVFEVNFFAAASLTRLALPDLVASRGRIVVMSSVVGLVGTPTRSGYAASKQALHGLFEAVRVELKPQGVSVTLVCPGFVDTAVRARALLADGTPQGADDATGRRMMTPQKVAKVTLQAAAKRRRLVKVGMETHLARVLSLCCPGVLERVLVRRGR